MDELLRLYYAATSPEGQGRTNPRKPLAKPLRAAIKSITGKDFQDAQVAKDWWKRNKSGFRNKARKPEK